MKRILLLFLLIPILWGFISNHTAQPVPEGTRSKMEMPDFSPKEQIISHIGYTLSYNSEWLCPNWVAYELTNREVIEEGRKISTSFQWDPDLKGRRSDREDYKNEEHWDKGHMAPRADMKWSEQACKESYYLTNVCPQNHTMNAGIWLKTEELGRRIAQKTKSAYIVCGPIFKQCKHGTLGKNKVGIPDAFFKAILTQDKGAYTAIAFIMPNEPEKKNIKTYALSVNDLEKQIHKNLFFNLPDEIEEKVEDHINYKFWGLQ